MNITSVRMLLIITMLLGFVSSANATSLNIYNWQGYTNTTLIKEFEQNTGIEIELFTYASVEELERAIEQNDDYDIVVPTHFQLSKLIAENKIEELDLSKLPNHSQIDQSLLAALAGFNGANKYAIPFLWTAIGIVYDEELLTEQLPEGIPDSWALVFYDGYLDRLAQCGVSWVDAPKEVFSLKANFVGENLGRSSDRRLQKYFRQLAKSAQYVKKIDNQSYLNMLSEEEFCVSIAWAGHALEAKKSRSNLNFILPEEGGLLTIDSWVIVKNSAKKDAAYQFINFMLEQRSGARHSAETHFFSHLPPATAHLDGEGLNPREVLGEDYRQKLYFVENLEEDQNRLVEMLWQSISSSM